MTVNRQQIAIVTWLGLASLFAFVLFGRDKFLAARPGSRRISEFVLLSGAALGGWLGGLAAMLLFRHKTAKLTFQLKFAAAFIFLAALVYAALTFGR